MLSVVKLKEDFLTNESTFRTTTIKKYFCGELVNQYDGKFYFELNSPEKALVIIPHKHIEWMAPLDCRRG